jgi:hypothetical protein
VDPSGFGFFNFVCYVCSTISLENDLKRKVLREERNLDKRGTRSTGGGRRIGYLQISEFAKHNRELSRKLKYEKFLHLAARARIVQRKVKRPTLRELAREVSSKHNVTKFCTSIINAHRSGAFGGKPALWDFLSDVAQNLNRDARGSRYSESTKCLGEVMKVYRG